MQRPASEPVRRVRLEPQRRAGCPDQRRDAAQPRLRQGYLVPVPLRHSYSYRYYPVERIEGVLERIRFEAMGSVEGGLF